jgi:type II secretory pathway component PulC
MSRSIAAIITAITGDRVIIGEDELKHAVEEHFPMLPKDILLELIERILKDPTKIFEQIKLNQYHLFYRLDNRRYLVVIVKKTSTGSYFASMYSTGISIRNSHKELKEVKP